MAFRSAKTTACQREADAQNQEPQVRSRAWHGKPFVGRKKWGWASHIRFVHPDLAEYNSNYNTAQLLTISFDPFWLNPHTVVLNLPPCRRLKSRFLGNHQPPAMATPTRQDRRKRTGTNQDGCWTPRGYYLSLVTEIYCEKKVWSPPGATSPSCWSCLRNAARHSKAKLIAPAYSMTLEASPLKAMLMTPAPGRSKPWTSWRFQAI